MLFPLILASVASASLVVESTSYSYYMFTIEWKPTMCMTTTCEPGYYGEAFNVHGLWPSTSPGQGPENCNGPDFSVSNSVQTLLETCWLSDSSTPQAFWEHEWSKHGTCVSPAMTPDTFFTKVVSIFNSLGMQAKMASAGVTPNNDKTYALTKVYSSLSNKFNLSCYCKSGTCYLETLSVCLDLNFNLMDCEESSSGCTDSELIFPSSD